MDVTLESLQRRRAELEERRKEAVVLFEKNRHMAAMLQGSVQALDEVINLVKQPEPEKKPPQSEGSEPQP